MKPKIWMSMKWKLTLGATGVLLIVGAILFFVIQISNQETDKMLIDALKGRAVANASTASGEIGFEIFAKLSDEVEKKLRTFISTHRETHSISVLNKNKKPIVNVGKKIDIKNLLVNLPYINKKSAIVVGELVVATSPVSIEEQKNTLGYVVYTESMKDYYAMRREAVRYATGAFFLGLLIIMAGAYFIGHSSTEPIFKLISTAEAISAGDLEKIEIKTEESNSSETNRLASSIKSMAEALQKQVMAIKTLINNMVTMSTDAASIVSQLASSASQQASAVTETATTVEQMEKTGKSAEGNANRIVNAAEKTTETSIRGREAVRTTNDIINRIREDSQEISNQSSNMLTSVEEIEIIINTVKGIADQSKILAVNASIEAAKAGQYGSGFAVVAQEVKDLAEQSKEATLQITGTLTSIRQAIENMVNTAKNGKQRTEEGVTMISNAGAIMNDLSEAIKENSEFANVISVNIKQHTVGLSQIAIAMDQINSTAIENQSISSKIEQSVQQITSSIGELQNLVDKWRTPMG